METVESINKQLKDLFGVDTITGLSIWRVVWSEDQFEKRLGTYDDYTKAGLYLRTVTEVREVPKYKQWIKERYVLEQLVLVPEINKDELPTQKMSYEPLWVFQTTSGAYLPPKVEACKLIADSVYAAMDKSNLAKYKDPLSGLNSEDLVAQKAQEIDNLQEELFGNESYVGDALAHKEAVIVPRNYKSPEVADAQLKQARRGNR